MFLNLWRKLVRVESKQSRRRRRKPARRLPVSFKPWAEVLETRLAPVTFAVNSQFQVTPIEDIGGAPGGAHAVVFFESSIADYQILRQGLTDGTDAVILDSGGDGVGEMAALLAGRHFATDRTPFAGAWAGQEKKLGSRARLFRRGRF